MGNRVERKHITHTTAGASGGTTIEPETFKALERYEEVQVVAQLRGVSSDTLDVYLQRKVADNVWADWCHFPQIASGAAVKTYSVTMASNNGAVLVGSGTDASPGQALAANTYVGGHPGDELRIVSVAGASTSASADQDIYLIGYRYPRG